MISFFRPEEIARQLDNSGAKYIVTIEMFLQNIKQASDIYKVSLVQYQCND